MNIFVCFNVNSPEVILSIHSIENNKKKMNEKKEKWKQNTERWNKCVAIGAFAVVWHSPYVRFIAQGTASFVNLKRERVFSTQRCCRCLCGCAAAGIILINITLINNCWNNARLITIARKINSLLSRCVYFFVFSMHRQFQFLFSLHSQISITYASRIFATATYVDVVVSFVCCAIYCPFDVYLHAVFIFGCNIHENTHFNKKHKNKTFYTNDDDAVTMKSYK